MKIDGGVVDVWYSKSQFPMLRVNKKLWRPRVLRVVEYFAKSLAEA